MLSVIWPAYAQRLFQSGWREWRRDEDFLTVEFFGLVRYAPRGLVRELLSAAIKFGSNERLSLRTDSNTSCWDVSFWTSEIEGDPDLVLRRKDGETTELALVVEVKLHSGPSDRPNTDPQLERYARLAKRVREETKCAGGLVYLTLDAPAEATQAQLVRAAAHLDGDLWLLRWHDIANVVFGWRNDHRDNSPTSLLLADLYAVLRSRGIMAAQDIPEVRMGPKAVHEVQTAHAIAHEYAEQVVRMVGAIEALCQGRDFRFKHWWGAPHCHWNQLPRDAQLAITVPFADCSLEWRTDDERGQYANPQGATWLHVEFSAPGAYVAVCLMRPRDKFTDEAFNLDWDRCIASQFGCDPDRIFDERRRDTPGGTLYAWKTEMSLLLSGHDFARLVLAPLEQAMNELALSTG